MGYRTVWINGEMHLAYVPEASRMSKEDSRVWLGLIGTVAGFVVVDYFFGNLAASLFLAGILAFVGFFIVRALTRLAVRMVGAMLKMLSH